MHLIARISSCLLVLGLLACTPSSTARVENGRVQRLELPAYDATDSITTHEGFRLLYNETHEQAQWVAYELTASETGGPAGRTGDYREDPSIATGSATLADYRRSGYDRGHLIPAGDARWSKTAMSATFLLSNISPQEPGFNRGDWRTLESKVRAWATQNRSVYVVAGPALRQGIKAAVGANRVIGSPLLLQGHPGLYPAGTQGHRVCAPQREAALPAEPVCGFDRLFRITYGLGFLPLASRPPGANPGVWPADPPVGISYRFQSIRFLRCTL